MPMFKVRGVHVLHHKHTANKKAIHMISPKEVIIPMAMHIGAPATPIVKVGDIVSVGQKIAEANGFISAPIHASISGKVKKIEPILMGNGQKVPAIFIESDGKNTISEEVKPHPVTTHEEFVEAVKQSGVVGLGGAGFPTYVKLAIKDLSKVEEVIINGAECEPYITADTRTMVDELALIKDGVNLLKQFIKPKKIIFGVENNKLAAIKNLKKLSINDKSVDVHVLKAEYPQGAEKVLIYNTTKKVVPEGKLPLDVGVVIMNITTLTAIARYINTGMPLVEKVVTIDGSAVKKPMNIVAPVGTKLIDVFKFVGGFKTNPYKVIYGGPMMGMAVPNLEVPILKNTNAVLAFNEKDSHIPESTPCIRCGRCINHCPLNLDPVAISKGLELKRPEDLEKIKANLCMECGVCSYVCPAKRPLVQNNKLAKIMLKEYLASKKEKGE